MERLLYLAGCQADVNTTPEGYYVVDGIEQYEDAVCREKVIFRVDLMSCCRDVFSEDFLKKYRDEVFQIISGCFRDKKVLSDVFMGLYKEDTVFRTWLGVTYYFTDSLRHMSLYRYLIEYIKDEFNASLERVTNFFSTASLIYTSSGYAYFALSDKETRAYSKPEGFECEVVSYSRVWPGFVEE